MTGEAGRRCAPSSSTSARERRSDSSAATTWPAARRRPPTASATERRDASPAAHRRRRRLSRRISRRPPARPAHRASSVQYVPSPSGRAPSRRRRGRRRWRRGRARRRAVGVARSRRGYCAGRRHRSPDRRDVGTADRAASRPRGGASPYCAAVARPTTSVAGGETCPPAILMLAPSAVILGVFVDLPARSRRCGSGTSAATCRRQLPLQRAGTSTSTCSAATSSSTPSWVTIKFAADHRAARPRARRRSRRARRQVPARHRRVPGHLLVDGRHVGRRRQPDVAVPAAADVGVLANIGWIADAVPGRSRRPGCCATPAPRSASVAAVERLGQPRVHVHPRHRRAAGRSRATSTRRPWSTAPAASAGSGQHHRCRCSGRRCCSSLIVLDDAGVPGLRRDRPADPGGPRPDELDDDDHVPHLRQHSIIRNDLGLQAAIAVLLFLVLLVLSALQLRGHRAAGALWREPASDDGVRPRRAAAAGGPVGRYGLLVRSVSVVVLFPIYTTVIAAVQAGRRGARAPAACPTAFTLDVLREAWTDGPPRALPAQLARRRDRS